MAYVECGNGHIYDTDMNQSCPYCQGNSNRVEFNGGDSSYGKTVPVFGAGTTQSAQPQSEVGATVAPASYVSAKAEKEAPQAADTGKTVAVFKKSANVEVEPVVGWFVCIDGPDKGKDFKILAKNNSVGRSEKMDICISGDSTISREDHARIGYDEKHNQFHLIPGNSTNNVYIGEDPIYVPTKIEAYQVIELGETKLLFVPLCNDKFNWKEGLK